MKELLPFCAPIETFGDGTFQPAEEGDMALILPVEDECDEVVDHVAWYGASAGAWWLQKGEASLLGAGYLFKAACAEKPATLCATPHEWLYTARPNPVCILSWQGDPRDILRGPPQIDCTSEQLRQQLRRRILECAAPTYSIEVAV